MYGSYIYGHETSIPRDKTRDKYLFIKYIIGSPLSVPLYIYKNKIYKYINGQH